MDFFSFLNLNRWKTLLVWVGSFFISLALHAAPDLCLKTLENTHEHKQNSLLEYSETLFESESTLRDLHEVLTLEDSPELNNSIFLDAIEKKQIFPDEPLTNSELQALEARPIQKKIYQLQVNLNKKLSTLKEWNQQFHLYWNKHPHVSTATPTLNWKDKVASYFKWVYNGPIRFFIPVLMPKWRSSVEKIFYKTYRNPSYEPTSEELTLLKSFGAEKQYQEQKDFQKRRPTWHKIKKRLVAMGLALQIANMGLIGNWALHLAEPNTLVEGHQFLNQSEFRLKPHQVRIFNESVPFPHMAIEIDGKVYSYGQTHMNISASRDYLMSEEIHQIFAIDKTANAAIEGKDWLQLDKIMTYTGLNSLPRSVQAVTLNLDPQQKGALKRFLSLSQFHAYRNQTLVMDCASMITLALQRNTTVPLPLVKGYGLDASPSMMMMYYGALKSMEAKNESGQALVADIRQIAMAEAQRPDLHFWRNLYINALESKIFWTFLPINMTMRAYMNIRYGEQDFQYLQPEVKKEIEGWLTTLDLELRDPKTEDPDGQQLQILIQEAESLQATPLDERDENWKTRQKNLILGANFFLDREIAVSHDTSTSPDSSFADIARHSYREQILSYYKRKISETELQTSSGRSISAPDLNPTALIEAILKSNYL